MKMSSWGGGGVRYYALNSTVKWDMRERIPMDSGEENNRGFAVFSYCSTSLQPPDLYKPALSACYQTRWWRYCCQYSCWQNGWKTRGEIGEVRRREERYGSKEKWRGSIHNNVISQHAWKFSIKWSKTHITARNVNGPSEDATQGFTQNDWVEPP
jgi:hypothetical protein